MQDIVDSVNELSLNALSANWVQAVSDSEFIESFEWPQEYEAVIAVKDVAELLANLMQDLDDFLASDETSNLENRDKSWAFLSRELPVTILNVALFQFMDQGLKNCFDGAKRTCAINSARIYMKFVGIAGSTVYEVYHSELYKKSFECLKFSIMLLEQLTTRVSGASQEVDDINSQLICLCVELSDSFSGLGYLLQCPELEECVEVLVEVGAFAKWGSSGLSLDPDIMARLWIATQQCTHSLMLGGKEVPHRLPMRMLFKSMLLKIVESTAGKRALNKQITGGYMSYCKSQMDTFGKHSYEGIHVLLHHVCTFMDGLDKTDVRVSRAEVALYLMSVLPPEEYDAAVTWITVLINTEKAPVRLVALEIVSSLLPIGNMAVPEQEDNQLPNANDNVQPHANDDSQADVTQSQETLASVPEPSENDAVFDSQSSADAGSDEECESLPPREQLLLGVLGRCDDVSSNVRSKALGVITSCVASDRRDMRRAILRVNGSQNSRLVSLAMRCAGDERAAVRKAGVNLLESLLKKHTSLIDMATLQCPVSLCRDASLVVRTEAINCLHNLLLHFPHEATIQAFLKGPLHHLSDPEPKIVNLVQNYILEMVYDKLVVYGSAETSGSMLAWMFVAELIKSNMRKHLSKATKLIINANNNFCFRKVVNIIKSHIGMRNNLSAWVLLTCISPHYRMDNVTFVLDYYNQLSENTEETDMRPMSLVLDVLMDWAKCLSMEQRSALHTRLVSSLAQAGGGPDATRRLVVVLAANLQPQDKSWANHLLHQWEKLSRGGRPPAEWLAAADVALVSPDPPPPVFMERLMDYIARALSFKKEELERESVSVSLSLVSAALGRLTLRSRESAEVVSERLAQLLSHQDALEAPRINALFALVDISTRFTTGSDKNMVKMWCSLFSACGGVRRAASRALTRLLLSGFMRLRPPYLFPYCALLEDPDEGVRDPVEFYVTRVMPPELIAQFFVETIMRFNNYAAPRLTHKMGDAEEFSQSCNLEGPNNSASRMHIYDLFLQRLSAVQRSNVQMRLARDVLAHAALAPAPRAAALDEVLEDTFSVLTSPRMKPPQYKPRGVADANAENFEEELLQQITDRVTTNVVQQRLKLVAGEMIVPSVVALVRKPTGARLHTQIVRFIKDLMRDYKEDVEEILNKNPELKEQVSQLDESEPPRGVGGARRHIVVGGEHEPELPTPSMRRLRPPRAPAIPPLAPPTTPRPPALGTYSKRPRRQLRLGSEEQQAGPSHCSSPR